MAETKGNTKGLHCEKAKAAEALLYGAIQNIQAVRQVAKTTSLAITNDDRAVYALEAIITMLSVIGFKTESALHLIEAQEPLVIVGGADDWLLTDAEFEAVIPTQETAAKEGTQ